MFYNTLSLDEHIDKYKELLELFSSWMSSDCDELKFKVHIFIPYEFTWFVGGCKKKKIPNYFNQILQIGIVSFYMNSNVHGKNVLIPIHIFTVSRIFSVE